MQKRFCDDCGTEIGDTVAVVEVVPITFGNQSHDFIIKRPAGLENLDLCEPCRTNLVAKIAESLIERVRKQEPRAASEQFNAAVEFARFEGMKVESTGAGRYLTWQFNDRERALLVLLRKELTNHRGIRIPIPNRIT